MKNKAVRLLMWAHYIYLLLLPTLAVIAAQMMFPEDQDFWQQMLIFGFPPVLMYTLFLANGYTLPNSLPIALVVTLAIPLQIALGVFLYGGGSIWLFFAESAAVEIGSFAFGTLAIALTARSRDYPVSVFVVLLIFILVLFFGGMIPHLLSVYYGYGGWSLWLVLFVTSFATAFWEYTKVYKNAMAAHRKRSEAQNLVLKFDGGIIARIFGIDREVPMISPLYSSDKPAAMSTPIMIFGFTAMFLPLVASMIIAIAFGFI